MIANEFKSVMEKYNGYSFTVVDASGVELEVKDVTDGKIVIGKKEIKKEEKPSVLKSAVEAVREIFTEDCNNDKEEKVEMINPSEIVKSKKK